MPPYYLGVLGMGRVRSVAARQVTLKVKLLRYSTLRGATVSKLLRIAQLVGVCL